VLSQIEASGQIGRFTGDFGRSSAAAGPELAGPGQKVTAGVVDSASYQALLVNLGLRPDRRLCVPAVHR
jgi:hypothetical protein